jgi:hypothetical protein
MTADSKGRKRPRDPNQLAKSVVELATMDDDERKALQERNANKKVAQKPGKRGSSSAKG